MVPKDDAKINEMESGEAEEFPSLRSFPDERTEGRSFSVKSKVAGIVAIGAVCVLAGVLSKSSSSESSDNTESRAIRFEFPMEDYGVVAQMRGNRASQKFGEVTLGADNILHWSLQNLPDGSSGSISIRENSSCDYPGEPWFLKGTAPWEEVKWSSNSHGSSSGFVDVDDLDAGIDFATNVDKTVVIESASGERVACGSFEPLTSEGFLVRATIARYPGLDTTINVPSGYAYLSPKNVLSWDFKDLSPNAKISFHIHEGLTCQGSGGHFYQGDTDGWTQVKAQASDKGTTLGSVNVSELEGTYKFAANVNHALVVHSEDGTRVACGVLAPFTVIQEEQTLGENHRRYYSVSGKFSLYPGASDDVEPKGTVWLDSNNVFSWSISGLPADASGGIHIHEGFTCETSGDHHWDRARGTDGWGAIKYETNSHGDAYGKFDLDSSPAMFPFIANLNHAVVIHLPTGERVGCAILEANEEFGAVADLALVSGDDEDKVAGYAALDSANVLTWELSGLPSNAEGLISVRSGYSCSLVRESLGDWSEVQWRSSEAGTAKGMVAINHVEGAASFNDNVDRVVVANFQNGTFHSCGKLLPFVFYAEETEIELDGDFEADLVVSANVKPLKLKAGLLKTKGVVAIDSDNILSYDLRKLEGSETGEISIYSGETCKSLGEHHTTGDNDGWKVSRWFSTESGHARGLLDLETIEGAYPFAGNLNRIVVVKNSFEEVVSCAELKVKRSFGVRGTFDAVPASDDDTENHLGEVFLTNDNDIAFVLRGLRSSESGTVSIYSASGRDACENDFGNPLFQGRSNPWDEVTFKASGSGLALGLYSLESDQGVLDFSDYVNHAVVVKDDQGNVVLCAVLDETLFNIEREVNHALQNAGDELENNDDDDDDVDDDDDDDDDGKNDFEAAGDFDLLIDDYEAFKGSVSLNEQNVLRFNLEGLPASSSGGIHIHLGRSCEDYQGHFYSSAEDPWLDVKWKSDRRGYAEGKVRVNDLHGAYSYAANVNHAVVVHSPEGPPAACAILSSNDVHVAVNGDLNASSKASGSFLFTDENALFVNLRKLEANTKVVIRIHEGPSCRKAGAPKDDKFLELQADGKGKLQDALQLDEYFPSAENFEDTAYQVIKVYQQDKTVGCAVLDEFRLF